MAVEKFTPDLDPSAFLKVGSTGLTNWQAVNEIIANSIDSWISTGPKKNLSIEIDLHNNPANLEEGKLIITDNMITIHENFIDLAPNISRHKLVVECIYKNSKLQMIR